MKTKKLFNSRIQIKPYVQEAKEKRLLSADQPEHIWQVVSLANPGFSLDVGSLILISEHMLEEFRVDGEVLYFAPEACVIAEIC